MKPGSEKSTEKKLEKLKSAEVSRLGPELYRRYLLSQKKRLLAWGLVINAAFVAAILLGITALAYKIHAGSTAGYWEALLQSDKMILLAGGIFLTWAWSRSPLSLARKLVPAMEKSMGYSVNEQMSLIDFRVACEKQKSWLPSVLINSILVFYLAGGIYYLAAQIYEATIFSASTLGKIALGSLLYGALWARSRHSLGRTVIERTNPVLKSVHKHHEGNWFYSFSGVFTLVLAAFTLYAGFLVTKIDTWKLVSAKGINGAINIFGSIVRPDWSITGTVLNSMVETIFIALMATLVAVPIAFFLSFFTARNLMKGHAWTLVIYNFFRVSLNFTRSIEPLVWAIIFSVWVGVGPFAGMLALMLHSVASLCKLYSEQIESIDRGPIEALEATGSNRILTVWYGVVPQIILPYVSFTIYRWDINVRMATVIGLVGGGGIGNLLNLYMLQARWEQVGTIVLVVALVVWTMDYLSAKIREAVY